MGLSPISASLGAMGSLPWKLDELLATGHWALRGLVMDEIEQLTTDLHILYNFLVKLSTAQDPPMTARYWMKDVRDLSYDMLDCADQFVHANDRAKIRRATRRKIITRLKINCLPERWKWRPWITNKVSEFRIRAREATQRYWRYNLDGCSSNPGYSCFRRELPSILPDPGDLVGIEGPMNELQRWLANGEEQLKVVSIVGVGGIGKTTLAQKLWGKLHRQFECRAFVRTAQKPDMRGLIRSILSQVRRHQPHQPPDSGEMHHLIRDLREYLRNKRYFVIIDDLWATSVWDVLSRAFPEDNCCSRIITITEIMEVALACCGFCPEHIFKMECLSDDDSEKLLLRNILVPGNQQFDNVLPQIKRNCGGLPLAIIIAASLLASQPEKLEQLGCMQNSFGVNHTMEGFMGQTLNISFNNLPHYLKTCLLHLSTHPEGHLFFKGDLVKQWVAEGFICAKEGEDMEEVAGSYFDELVSTGLIQAMDINYNYEVLSYSVHHMVLDFITYKSIEDNFITVVDYSQTTMPVIDKVRRLSLHFGSATYATTPASIRLSQVRSLFFSGLFNCVPSFMVFKLLRVLVLHFSGDTGNTSFNLQGICELFSLRYLQVACNVPVKLPDQIEPMKNLKTLEMNVGVCAVPPDIVRLSNLLHLRLRSETKLPDGVGCMRSLRTLMYFDLVSSSEDNILGLGELTNLRDLHLTCSSSLSSEHLKKKLIALSTSVGKLGNLKSFMLASGAAGTAVTFDALSSMYSTPIFLERLELLPRICVFSRFPKWIGQLHKLRVQKIAVRELLMNDIDSLTGLHSLTVLSLCVKTAPERRIVFNDGAFPFLKYFKFRCGILYMSFMSGAMDNLRRLKLRFNAHIGEKYDNMLAGVEHLLNLQDIAGQIGAATESEKRASESALKDAISKHPRCPNFNVKWVDPVDEEYHPSKKHHQMQGGLSGEKHGVLEKAEDTNKYADGWLSQNSDLPSSVASCRLKSGLMENFSPRTLLNSISHIGVLTSDGSTARPKPIQKYCQNVCDISSIVRPLIEDICISPEEQLNEVLMELDSAINEASGLIGNWHQTTSKIYFVWQIESVISDIQGCSLQLCQLANSLLPSLTDCACICIQKLQDIKYEHIFDLVKEVARELNGKDTQSPENLSIVSSSLSLSTNLELYMEAVSLENLRTRAMRSENRKELELVEEMISMVNYMHERLLRETQLLNINGVPIPADFCCPLSLELMSDPVILASGQTYERVYIKLWLDEGFTICPKARQRLAHSNLIPNYTVKALISNWRESTGNSPLHRSAGRGIFPGSSEADLYMRSLNRASPPHSAVHQNSDAHVNRPGHERESSLEGRHAGFNSGQLDGECDTNSGMICVPSDRANYSCDASGEVADGGPSVAQKENTILPILGDVSLRGQFVWQQTSDKGSPRIKSSSSMDARGDLSAIENQVCKLIDDLRSNSKEAQRSATSEIHLLAKHNMENRIVIANCGAINLLVGLLHSPDAKKQENAVTALLNLSINDNNKIAIANAGAVDPLIHVLETGNPEAKENSAATLFSLSVIEENKMRIGRSGAIKLLVDLLANGTLQGKKDAATALFNLSVLDENKGRIVQAGAVKHLVELMDPAARMVDKAVAVVANLATIPEGRTAIGQARGIPALVDVVQLGSARGKENAAAALLQLCTNSNRFCSIVLQEGAVPPLVALSQSGTPRAREKAQALLSYFRSQRHGNSARR